MDTPIAQVQTEQSPAPAIAIPAVDNLTDAILTGEAPSAIQRLEAAVENPSETASEVPAAVEQKNDQGQQVQPAPAEPEADPEIEPQEHPEAGVEPQGDEPQAGQKGKRMRADPKSAAFISLQKAGIAPDEAYQRVYGGEQKPSADQHQEIPAGDPPPMNPVETLELEVAEIEAQLNEAGANQGFFNSEIAALVQKLSTTNAKLEVTRERVGTEQAQQQQRQVQTEQAKRNESLTTAVGLYEDLAVKDSPLWKEANRIATDPSHPDYDPDRASKPNAPLLIAKLAAANLGVVAKVQPQGQVKPAPSSVSQPTAPARPASGQKQTAPPPPQKTLPEIVRDSEAATLAAIEGGDFSNNQQPSRILIIGR